MKAKSIAHAIMEKTRKSIACNQYRFSVDLLKAMVIMSQQPSIIFESFPAIKATYPEKRMAIIARRE